METALSRAQMVPSGGLVLAKMAPAGTQMGSGNLINAGIVSTQWTEKREKGKIRIHTSHVDFRASTYTVASIHKYKRQGHLQPLK